MDDALFCWCEPIRKYCMLPRTHSLTMSLQSEIFFHWKCLFDLFSFCFFLFCFVWLLYTSVVVVVVAFFFVHFNFAIFWIKEKKMRRNKILKLGLQITIVHRIGFVVSYHGETIIQATSWNQKCARQEMARKLFRLKCYLLANIECRIEFGSL